MRAFRTDGCSGGETKKHNTREFRHEILAETKIISIYIPGTYLNIHIRWLARVSAALNWSVACLSVSRFCHRDVAC